MSIALKGLGALAAIGGVATVGVFFFSPETLGIDMSSNVVLYGITDELTAEATPDIKLAQDKNYQCKLGDSSAKYVDCEVSWFNLESSNKLTNTSRLTAATTNTDTITTTALKTKHKAIKVTFKTLDFDWNNLKHKVSIVNSKDRTKTYASFTPLFGFDEDKKLGSVQYFLATSTNSTDVTITSSDNYHCYIDIKENTKQTCEIYKLHTDDQADTTRITTLKTDGKLAKETSTIKPSHYYLIKITTADYAYDITDTDIAKIIITKQSDSADVVSFAKITPAVIAQTADSDGHNVFVLD